MDVRCHAEPGRQHGNDEGEVSMSRILFPPMCAAAPLVRRIYHCFQQLSLPEYRDVKFVQPCRFLFFLSLSFKLLESHAVTLGVRSLLPFCRLEFVL